MIKQYLETGKIVGTHGIYGTVRVQPWSDSGDFFKKFDTFYFDSKGSNSIKATNIRIHGNVVLIDFESINTVEEAEKLRNNILFINRDDVTLPDGRYFIDDLIGCKVYDADDNKLLGIISEVSATGANDVWHIVNNGKEYLLPAVDHVIIETDLQNEIVKIRPMKGIFDDED